MIKRIVRMDLLTGKEATFLDIFERVKRDIRSQEGCMGLELLKSETLGIISVWTISIWQSDEALERYRNSLLFQQTWASVKPLFAGKAEAWTLTPIDML
jgi:quinol monooxygenase YgiN